MQARLHGSTFVDGGGVIGVVIVQRSNVWPSLRSAAAPGLRRGMRQAFAECRLPASRTATGGYDERSIRRRRPIPAEWMGCFPTKAMASLIAVIGSARMSARSSQLP